MSEECFTRQENARRKSISCVRKNAHRKSVSYVGKTGARQKSVSCVGKTHIGEDERQKRGLRIGKTRMSGKMNVRRGVRTSGWICTTDNVFLGHHNEQYILTGHCMMYHVVI